MSIMTRNLFLTLAAFAVVMGCLFAAAHDATLQPWCERIGTSVITFSIGLWIHSGRKRPEDEERDWQEERAAVRAGDSVVTKGLTVLAAILLGLGLVACAATLTARQTADAAIKNATLEIQFFEQWSETFQVRLTPAERQAFRKRRAGQAEPAIKQARTCHDAVVAQLGKAAAQEPALAAQAQACTAALQESLRGFEAREDGIVDAGIAHDGGTDAARG